MKIIQFMDITIFHLKWYLCTNDCHLSFILLISHTLFNEKQLEALYTHNMQLPNHIIYNLSP